MYMIYKVDVTVLVTGTVITYSFQECLLSATKANLSETIDFLDHFEQEPQHGRQLAEHDWDVHQSQDQVL